MLKYREARKNEIIGRVYGMLPPQLVANSPPRYIVRDYSPLSYFSEYIKDEDVVRPFNQMYTTENDMVTEVNHWCHKSMAGHQTYGTCDICFDSGPLMEECHHCSSHIGGSRIGRVYKVFLFGGVELDSICLAYRLDRELYRQKADREFDWEQPETATVTRDDLASAVVHYRLLSEARKKEIIGRVFEMLPPYQRMQMD